MPYISDSSDSSDESSDQGGPATRAEALSLVRHAKAEHKSAKAKLRDARRLKRKAGKLRRELESSLSIASATPNSSAREIKKKKEELASLSEHIASKTCKCEACQAERALKLVREAKEALLEARATCKELEREGDQDVLSRLEESEFLAEDTTSLDVRLAWGQVSQITASDFPVKLIFLDKSGSMGGSKATLDALALGAYRAARPTRGTHITFLMAGPGETQLFIARAGDTPPESMRIQLGSATWFNEPVLRTLMALSASAEAVRDLPREAGGEPPVSVVCMTDGLDNCSPSALSSLSGLCSSVRAINGPTSRKQLFEPVCSPTARWRADTVPVFMLWVVLGAGSQLLEGGVPSCVSVVNVPMTSGRLPAPQRAAPQLAVAMTSSACAEAL